VSLSISCCDGINRIQSMCFGCTWLSGVIMKPLALQSSLHRMSRMQARCCTDALSVCLSVSVGGWWCLWLIVQSVKVILNTRQWQSSVFEWIRQTVLRVNSSTNDRTFSVVFFRSKQFFLSPQLIHLVLTKFGISLPNDGFSPTSLHGGGFWGSFVRDMPVNERLLVYFSVIIVEILSGVVGVCDMCRSLSSGTRPSVQHVPGAEEQPH